MSNHTTATVTSLDQEAQELRRRCLEQSDERLSELRRCAYHLRQQGEDCSRMASELARIEGMGVGVIMSLNRLDSQIHELGSDLRELAHEAEALAGQIEETARAGRQVLPRAHADLQGLAAGQGLAEQQLQATGGEAHLIGVRLEQLTRELDRKMSEAGQLANAIEQSKEQIREVDNLTDQDLEALNRAARALQGVIGQWADLSGQLSQLNLTVDSHLYELQALGEAVNRSPALFALLENLRDFRFEHVRVFEGGLEAFLKDDNDRRIAITSRRAEKTADQLLEAIEVTIDLYGYDVGAETLRCDEEIARVLDVERVVIINSKTTAPPPPEKPAGEVVLEPTAHPESTDQESPLKSAA